jgi:predicted lipoprotein with Yx(FWY)xxD motif
MAVLALCVGGCDRRSPNDRFNGATDKPGDATEREPTTGPDADATAAAPSATTQAGTVAAPSGAAATADQATAGQTTAGETDTAQSGQATGAPTLRLSTAGATRAYLTNSAGSALYALEGDVNGEKCDAHCIEVWPPYSTNEARATGADGVDAGQIKSITRSDGRKQLTYRGKPLYRYAADLGVGRTGGHDVRDRWGHWRLLGPDGKELTDPIPRTPSAAPVAKP